MNREIKFRVWCIADKCFLKSDEGLEFEHPTAECPYFCAGINFYLKNQHLHTVQQFTGIKDKNGKEIYEGDIIKMDIKNGVVFFENGRFTHNGQSAYYGSLYWSEVIGNIFESPDLLK